MFGFTYPYLFIYIYLFARDWGDFPRAVVLAAGAYIVAADEGDDDMLQAGPLGTLGGFQVEAEFKDDEEAESEPFCEQSFAARIQKPVRYTHTHIYIYIHVKSLAV